MALRRIQFVRGSAGFLTLLVVGCDGGDEGEGSGCGDPEATISNNHSHVLEIPLADVQLGEPKTYSFSGGSHTHQVTFGAADFDKLREDGSVGLVSTTAGGHAHNVNVMC